MVAQIPVYSEQVDDILTQTRVLVERLRSQHERQMREQELTRRELAQLEREVDLLLVQIRQERMSQC